MRHAARSAGHRDPDLLLPSRNPRASYGLTASYEHFTAGAGLSDEFRIGFSCWL